MSVAAVKVTAGIARKVAILGVGMLLACNAWAGQFYVGGSVGHVKADLGPAASASSVSVLVQDFGLTGTVSVTQDNRDDTDTGYKIFGGYSFNKYFAMEVFYADFGRMKEDVTAALNVTDGTNTLVGTATLGARLDLTGYGVDLVGSYPVADRFSLFAKLGYFYHKVDADLALGFTGTQNGTPATLSEVASDSDNGSDYSFGFGADYHFNNNMAVRLDWQRYKVKAFDTDMDTDVIAGSLIYRF